MLHRRIITTILLLTSSILLPTASLVCPANGQSIYPCERGLERSGTLPLYGEAGRGLLPREIRAVWLTTLSGLDWPQRPAQTPRGWEQQRADLCRQLDEFLRAGINTVLLQTRIRGSVIYPSRIEAFDEAFTGSSTLLPDYDPLAFCVEECHRRGMECHAWVVCFPSGKFATHRRYGQRAINVRCPDLVQRAKEQWILDPAKQGTAPYLASICAEIVEGYDVDGIQLDYIRYPEPDMGFRTSLPLAQKRQNVTRCVREIYQRVKSIRPWCKVSCSPVGKYADLPRQSSMGWNARDAVAQDVDLWLRENIMDWVAPMMYFRGKHFYPFACDWMERSYGHPIAPGLGIYFLNAQQKDWPLTTITQEINFLRQIGAGQAYFRARFLLNNEKGLLHYVRDFNATPALWPALTWLDSIAPPAPHLDVQRTGFTLHLTWNAVSDDNPSVPVHYNVYRIPTDPLAQPVLLAQRLDTTSFSYAPALPALLHDRFVVTAIDAYGNESEVGTDNSTPMSAHDYTPLEKFLHTGATTRVRK